jgi:hypothetical protein
MLAGHHLHPPVTHSTSILQPVLIPAACHFISNSNKHQSISSSNHLSIKPVPPSSLIITTLSAMDLHFTCSLLTQTLPAPPTLPQFPITTTSVQITKPVINPRPHLIFTAAHPWHPFVLCLFLSPVHPAISIHSKQFNSNSTIIKLKQPSTDHQDSSKAHIWTHKSGYPNHSPLPSLSHRVTST